MSPSSGDPPSESGAALARLLPRLYRGGQAYLGVEGTLSGLNGEQAGAAAPGLPYSVAGLLAHVNWWNAWMLEVIETGAPVPYPAHAPDTWPSVQASDWERLKAEFYTLLSRIDTHAARPDLGEAVNFDETIGGLLADFALHTAHHFGQMIVVRRLIGAWPPPGGGDTW